MAATQRDSFYPTDRTNSQFMPLKVFGSERKLRYQERDQLDTRLIGKSEPMQAVKRSIRLVANSSETVLITGESGTGKELIAHAIHDLSARCRDPFLAINCGALTESLIESELFGHVKGAFTGASNSKKGFFEAARGGTIFLDEFAEMSLNTQQRLLRILQERTVRPIGSTDPKEIKIDTRVVVATNHDLKSDVSEGRFRKDLYYRVNVLEIRAPALREHPDDIPLLASHFIRHYNEKNGAVVSDELGTKALTILKAYTWPGNVRELENFIKRLALKVGDEGTITEPDLRSISEFSELRPETNLGCAESEQQKAETSLGTQGEGQCRCSRELDWYRGRIKEAGGSITEAARQLNIPRTTFRYRMMTLKSKCAVWKPLPSRLNGVVEQSVTFNLKVRAPKP